MTRYIIRRLLQAIPTLLGISILSFILVNAAPGDPVTMRTFGDPRMTEEARAIMRRQLGLDQPAIVQYFAWMTGLSVRRGDQVAMLRVTSSTGAQSQVPLYAAEDVERAGLARRGLDSLIHMAFGWLP